MRAQRENRETSRRSATSTAERAIRRRAAGSLELLQDAAAGLGLLRRLGRPAPCRSRAACSSRPAAIVPGSVPNRDGDFSGRVAISDSTRLVTKNAAARPAVTRVRKLAAPRPVMNPPPAAADAERAALGALQQHHADHGGGDHHVDDQQDGGHGSIWEPSAGHPIAAARPKRTSPGRASTPDGRRGQPIELRRSYCFGNTANGFCAGIGLRRLVGVVDLLLGGRLGLGHCRRPRTTWRPRPCSAAWPVSALQPWARRRAAFLTGAARISRQPPSVPPWPGHPWLLRPWPAPPCRRPASRHRAHSRPWW